ncbi:MAG: hypothetical protein ACI8UD_003983 [Planctomycetota bacterium]
MLHKDRENASLSHHWPGITTANDSVMATYQSGAGATIWAQEGDQAPGMPAGTVLSGKTAGNSANWNNSGSMLLGWNMADGGVSITAIYTNTLWFTDAAGKGTASFNLPAGLVSSTLLHHTCIGLDLSLMETFVTEPVSLKIN